MSRVYIAVLIACALIWTGCGSAVRSVRHNEVTTQADSAKATINKATINDNSPIGRAFNARARDVEVEGEGVVTRILADDVTGDRHQRFVVRLASGQTILLAHNIDIAPRVDGLREGDGVRFKGEYVWNEEGGIIHWTHHDPKGRHVAGWLKHNGKTYQ